MDNLMLKVENMVWLNVVVILLCNSSHVINFSDVSNAQCKLKARTADGTNDLMSDALINSGSSMVVNLSLLFSAILRHRVSPDNMLLATLIPIPKSTKKCVKDSTNYRTIAPGSVLSKLLDMVLLSLIIIISSNLLNTLPRAIAL
jgi:hypothetical protein